MSAALNQLRSSARWSTAQTDPLPGVVAGVGAPGMPVADGGGSVMSGAVGAYEYVVRPTEDMRGGHAYCAMAGAAPA